MKPKLLLIDNPVSGMTLGRLTVEEMSRILSVQYRVFVSITNAKDEAEATARSFGGDFNIVAVCGGDGTLNEVLRGIMDIDQAHRPALGIIRPAPAICLPMSSVFPRGLNRHWKRFATETCMAWTLQ